MEKKVSTYILYDKLRDIYKIGKSSNPTARIKTLCIPGEIEPIKLFQGDVESDLHKEFKDYRITHPLYKDGKTEWFRYGGKFKEFIDGIEPEEIAFYTPHSLYQLLEDEGQLRVDTTHTFNSLKENEYYRYIVGRKILILLGYIYYEDGTYKTRHPGVSFDGKKLFISARVIDEILTSYTVALASTHFDNYVATAVPGKVFVRKVGELPNKLPVYLLITGLKKW